MNIIDAIKDPELFRPFLQDAEGSIATWHNWLAALRVLYGLPVPTGRLPTVRQCTGRDPTLLPAGGFDAALLLTGRRSGKSRIAAVIGAFEAVLGGHERKLARGERGVVPICSPTRPQSRIVRDYIRSIFGTPLLAPEVIKETREGFDLRNGIRIEILAGDWRHVRGFTCVCVVVDEIAFFGLDEEAKLKSDTELVRAIKPALATTTGGKLICISSPYAKRGWTYRTHLRNFGNDRGRILVWGAPSRTMNETLPQSVVDDALAEDYQSARSEFLGEFREDCGEFLPRSVIEALVVRDRPELLPQPATPYVAFVDVSGGRGDDAALAIAHRQQKRTVVIDVLRRYRAPFDPRAIVGLMTAEIKRFGLRKVTGDNYAAEWVSTAFTACGIRYIKAEKPKSDLYAELLPRLTSGEVELLDDELLVNQLAGLERRTRSGGRDVIDHPVGSHDDLANAVAGAVVCAVPPRRVGAI